MKLQNLCATVESRKYQEAFQNIKTYSILLIWTTVINPLHFLSQIDAGSLDGMLEKSNKEVATKCSAVSQAFKVKMQLYVTG